MVKQRLVLTADNIKRLTMNQLTIMSISNNIILDLKAAQALREKIKENG